MADLLTDSQEESEPQGQPSTPSSAPNNTAWIGQRLEEERRKAAERARRETQDEFNQRYGAAIKLASLYQQAGYDPEQVATAYEAQLREAQAKASGLTPEMYETLQRLQQGQSTLEQQLAASRKVEHERELNRLLLQAEQQVVQGDQMANRYIDVIRQRMAAFANFTGDDNLPNIEQLVSEGRAAFRDLAWDEAMKDRAIAAQQSTLVRQQHRESHQTVTETTAVSPQLQSTDLRRLAASRDPKDQQLMEEYIAAGKSGDRERVARVMAQLGLVPGA